MASAPPAPKQRIISKGNITIVKEARLVNRQCDYICATGHSLRMIEIDDASDHSDPEESTSSAAATTITTINFISLLN